MVALARVPEEFVLHGAAATASRSAEAINGWALFVTGAWPLMVKAMSLLAQAQAMRTSVPGAVRVNDFAKHSRAHEHQQFPVAADMQTLVVIVPTRLRCYSTGRLPGDQSRAMTQSWRQ